MTQDLLESVEDGVATSAECPPVSRDVGAMLDALLEALPRLAEDTSVGVVVVTGAAAASARARRQGDGGGPRVRR